MPRFRRERIQSRRAFLALLINMPLLGACGFRPVYGPGADGAAGPAQEGLSQIAVGPLPERSGQLLRQALQDRVERDGVGKVHRYDLVVSFGVGQEGIAIQTDSSSSRTRVIGTANWRLMAQDPQRTTLTSGTARSVDGFNVIDQQYFAADLESETVTKRVAEAVADQIALQLAAYFNRRARPG
jgi:LPS-assembly lipoprotein